MSFKVKQVSGGPRPEVVGSNSFETGSNSSSNFLKNAYRDSNSSSNETVICMKSHQTNGQDKERARLNLDETTFKQSSSYQETLCDQEATNGKDSHRNDGQDENKQQKKFFRSFLLLTSYLNPFHHHHNHHNHNHHHHQQQHHHSQQNNNHQTDTTNKRCSTEFLANKELPQSTQSRSTFHLNLLNFAHRYLGTNRNSSELYYSKSAPNTPLKVPLINQDNCSLANGSLEHGNSSNQENKLEEVVSNQRQNRAVRFVEENSSFSSNSHVPLKYADCGSQTNESLTTRLYNGEVNIFKDNDDEEQVDGLSIVSKLFKEGNTAGEAPMNSEHFRKHGYSLIDYISNYLDTINKRRVTPLNIEPGYLKSLIQSAAPEKGESFASIMRDFETHIMCGITHWQHPHFHAYFPAGNAYPSILADMLSDALGCVGFSWAASPAYTELEIIMLNWMGKMIGLPEEFLCVSEEAGGESRGGGVIQGSASECVLVNLLAARHWAIERLRKKEPEIKDDGVLLSKLIGYCSKEAHSCVEKAAMIGFIRMRALDTDDKHALRGETLERAIKEDIAQGLEPFFVCATLGTTSCVSFDNIDELGTICNKFADHHIWLHVDAAYAGSALICPEFKYLIKGIERASSLNMNPNKWMLINFDCSLMWVKDRFKLTRAFVVDPLYLQHSYSDQAIDYRHWGIPLSRRFRALKLWFVIRNYGLEGLQAYIRLHVRLAKLFESLILKDSRFSIMNQVVLGLVCFRLVGSNALNQRLLSMINASGKLHMVPASLNGRYVIRFCVCDQNAKDDDIHYAYKCISEMASELLEAIKAGRERVRAISQQNTIDVSSVSIHTQQSVSAEPLDMGNSMCSDTDSNQPADLNLIMKANNDQSSQQVDRSSPSPREAARKYLLSSSRAYSNTHFNNNNNQIDSQQLEAHLTSKSPVRKQNSLAANTLETSNINGGEPDEELDQSIKLDCSDNQVDNYDDLDDLDDELLEPFNSNQTNNVHHLNESGSGLQLNGSAKSEHEEANDEVFNLTKRRNRMSLRYKREFFVRVVSDPRVYRASISGDINARASTSSLSGSGGGGGGGQQSSSSQQATSVRGNQLDSTLTK